MKQFKLRERAVPLDDSWDVIVVGGGPSGCTAAAAAAREGARTLLIEATGALGGMGTSGLVPAWCPFSDGEKIIYRGLAEKVFDACKAGMPHVPKEKLNWVPIDPELLKRIYDDLVTAAGATVLFNTLLVGAEAEGGVVSAVIAGNKSGLQAFSAPVYVDCTGDADLAAWAGAEYEKGDEDGALQPATHCFILTNVDGYALQNGPHVHFGDPRSPIHAIISSGKYPLIVDKHTCNALIGPGTLGFNTGHVFNVDNTDPAGASRALIHGRRMAAQYRDALAEYCRAFANCFLVATGSLLGVRETRRIIGDYVLTVDDYLARRSFPDEICRNSYCIDVHFSEKLMKELARDSLDAALRAINTRSCHYGKGESHGIPYRCLTPRRLRNVLVAGRAISTDRKVNGSVRVMPTCLATGEAAGLAAALAAAADSNVHAVDTAILRGKLKSYGAYLPDVEAP